MSNYPEGNMYPDNPMSPYYVEPVEHDDALEDEEELDFESD